jgi:hypothetical protein
MTADTISVFCTGLDLLRRYNVKNSIATVHKYKMKRLAISLPTKSIVSKMEMMAKPVHSEAILIISESRNAFPALLYFIISMTTASIIIAAIINIRRKPITKPAPPASRN